MNATIEIGKRRQSLRKRLEAGEMKAARDHLVDRDITQLLFTETFVVREISSHMAQAPYLCFDDVM